MSPTHKIENGMLKKLNYWSLRESATRESVWIESADGLICEIPFYENEKQARAIAFLLVNAMRLLDELKACQISLEVAGQKHLSAEDLIKRIERKFNHESTVETQTPENSATKKGRVKV